MIKNFRSMVVKKGRRMLDGKGVSTTTYGRSVFPTTLKLN
jgi:hypothetical protein